MAERTSAQEAVQRVFRSLGRPQGRGFQQALRKDVRSVDLVTPAGIFVGSAPAFSTDPRLAVVPSRIARGLLFHHTQHKLPPDYGIRAFPLEQIEYASKQRRASLAAFMAPVTSTAPPQQLGGVLTYWFSTVFDDQSASAWVMLFYGTAFFVALTAPEHRLAEIEHSSHAQTP